MNRNDAMGEIARERITEARIRQMDTSDIVAEIHHLEDRIYGLEIEIQKIELEGSDVPA